MKRLFLFTVAIGFLTIEACKKDEPTLGDPPTAADAQFTYEVSPTSDNIINFTASNASLTAKWDFGNGTTGEGTTVSASYPLAGEYTVTLTVFNTGGSNSSSQTITIAEDDATLLDNPLYTILTGGLSVGSKTWVIDSNIDAHFGVGPNPVGAAGNYPEWYAALCNEKAGSTMYDDEYKFTLNGFGFDMYTKGEVYVNANQSANFPGSYESPVADYIAPFEDQLGESWTIIAGEDTILEVSGASFLGYYTGVNTYQVVKMTENELFLRFLDASNAELAWYIRLIPKGYDSGNDCGGGGGGEGYSLPIDFETVEPEFTTFGNSTYAIIDNPDASGINTSSRVLETVHGSETWAGLFVNLEEGLDFSTSTTIALKIWAPATGTLRVKLEDQASPTVNFLELDVVVTTANEWIEVSVDFTGAASDLYDRLVLFPGWDVANAGTFYLDDIEQQ